MAIVVNKPLPEFEAMATGGVKVTNNVNVEAPGVIRSRNGHEREATGVGGPGWKMTITKELGVGLLFNYGSATAATGLKYGTGTSPGRIFRFPLGWR